MSITVKNEALRRYESDIKKLSQKIAAIENSLQTIKQSLDYDIKCERNIDGEFKKVCEEVDQNERTLNNIASFLSDVVKSYEDAEKKIKSDLDKISQKKSGGNVVTDTFSKLKSIGNKAEAILKAIIGMGIFGSPIGSIIVLGQIKKYYEQKGITLNNEEVMPVEVKNPDTPELSEILSHDPYTFKDDVLLLQKRLNELGYTDKYGRKLDQDGKFGDNTLAAVNKYKDQNGLWNFDEYAGKVGNTTWEHLFSNKSLYDNVIENEHKTEYLASTKIDPVYYSQEDPKWKEIMYSNHNDKAQTIGSSGCGPTSMAMVISTLTGKSVSPVDLCEFSLKNGYRTYDNGTAWDFFGAVAKKNNIKCVETKDLKEVKEALSDGKHIVIATMKPGHFTKEGHFIVITSVEAKNGNDWYTVFDPNIDNKRYGNDGMIEHGTRDDGIVKAVDSVFTSEGKQYWIFEKIGDNIELGDNFVTNKEDTVNINYNRLNNINEYVVQRGDTLIDIAKKFDTTVESLVKINNIRNANLISIGQVIEIPSVQTSKTKSSKTFVKAETIEAEKVSRNMEHSKSVASEIVSTFEGGKNALAGNFDGAGLSIGYIQMNLKYSLHLVLDAYANELDTKKEFESFFEFDTTFEKNGELIKMKGYEVIREVIKLPKEDRIKWGDSISDINSKTPKYGLKEPWRTAFKNMLKSDKFQHVYESSPHVQSYYSKANDIMNYIGMKTVRGYTLALDISVNNGSTPTKVVDEAMNSVPNRLTSLNDVYFDEIKNADKKKADIRVVKDLMNCLEGITDPMLKKAYYASAAAALQKSDGYSWDSWIRKKAIIQGKGEVHGIPINAKRLTDDSIISN